MDPLTIILGLLACALLLGIVGVQVGEDYHVRWMVDVGTIVALCSGALCIALILLVSLA